MKRGAFFFVCYSPPSASRPHLAMNDFDDDDDDLDDIKFTLLLYIINYYYCRL